MDRQALARLLRHRPLWPAVLIGALWEFGLCFGTPVLYYLTDHAHVTPPLTAAQYGSWHALFNACFLPTTALYGWVSRRWPLRGSLWAGTALAVLQVLPFLLMHSPGAAYAVAVWAGLSGGFVNGAYTDLLMRSAPKGLEGTTMMLGGSAMVASAAATSLVGASLYAHGGFALTVWATTLVYALIFPALLLVPRSVTATHDREAPTVPDVAGQPAAG